MSIIEVESDLAKELRNGDHVELFCSAVRLNSEQTAARGETGRSGWEHKGSCLLATVRT
jgi:hypothetical protein